MTGWTEVGDRVFVRRYEFYDQNIGVVLGGDDVLLIDTRSTHVQAREILDDLRELTTAPVTIVVDTHGHFDHAFGNHVFRPATIWGHDGCGPFLERTGEARRARVAAEMPEIAADLAEVVIDPPDRTFSETAVSSTSAIGASSCVHLGRGHTDHDIVIGVPDAAVLFAGDLIENGAVPVVRRRAIRSTGRRRPSGSPSSSTAWSCRVTATTADRRSPTTQAVALAPSPSWPAGSIAAT